MERIVFGTDYPFRTSLERQGAGDRKVFKRQEIAAIYRGNVAQRLPELV
jgi:hypothetical protein